MPVVYRALLDSACTELAGLSIISHQPSPEGRCQRVAAGFVRVDSRQSTSDTTRHRSRQTIGAIPLRLGIHAEPSATDNRPFFASSILYTALYIIA